MSSWEERLWPSLWRAPSLLISRPTWLSTYLREWLYDLRGAIYDHLQRLSFAYHDTQQTGHLMSRATADVEGVRWFISLGLVRSVHLIVLFGGITGLMMATNWKLGLISLGVLPLVAGRATFISRRLRVVWRNIQDMRGRMGGMLQENLAGARVVRAFSREVFEARKFGGHAVSLAEENVLASQIQASNAPLMNFIFAVITIAVLWVGAREVIDGRMTPGELTQFIFYLMLLAFPVRIVGWVITMFFQGCLLRGENIRDLGCNIACAGSARCERTN